MLYVAVNVCKTRRARINHTCASTSDPSTRECIMDHYETRVDYVASIPISRAHLRRLPFSRVSSTTMAIYEPGMRAKRACIQHAFGALFRFPKHTHTHTHTHRARQLDSFIESKTLKVDDSSGVKLTNSAPPNDAARYSNYVTSRETRA